MAKRSKKAKIKGSKGAIVALVVIVVVFCVAMFVVDSNPTGVEVLDNLAHTVVQTIKSLLAGTENPEPPQPTPPVNSQTYNVEQIQQEDLSIHFLQLGSDKTGDCVYIKAGETDLLIDAGAENASAPTLVAYLNQFVTDGKLEYVVATHGHEDHLGAFYSQSGRAGIFETYQTGTIIDFPLTNKTNPSDTSVVGRYYLARQGEIDQGAVHYTAAQCFNQQDGAKRVYKLSDTVELEILYNYYYFNTQSSGENDYSVCVMINQYLPGYDPSNANNEQFVNHYLFTGDLEEKGEKKMVEYYNQQGNPLPKCVLYKAGHHGSKTSSCDELMQVVQPQYVCVCCCAGTDEYTDTNENQFPTQQFVDVISKYTSNVYVTTVVDDYEQGTVKPMNGDIVFACTNGNVKMYFSNNATKLCQTDWFKQHRICPENWLELQCQ